MNAVIKSAKDKHTIERNYRE